MKLGIALGGGAARGYAHIGILDELTKAGIDFDVVVGTSAGALVGSAYAAGTLSDLTKECLSIRLQDIPGLLSPSWSLGGIFSGKKLLELLSRIIPAQRIEDLPKSFAAVSVDLRRAEAVTFTKGSVAEAVRASISIPAFFTPVLIDEQILVDGGTLEPVPVQAARLLGADFVLAVDLFANDAGEPLPRIRPRWSAKQPFHFLRSIRPASQAPAVTKVLEDTLAVVQKRLSEMRMKDNPADAVIAPPLSLVGLLEFHHAGPIIEIGRKAAIAALPGLKESLAKAGYSVPRPTSSSS